MAGLFCLACAVVVYWLWGHWGMSGIPPAALGGSDAMPHGWRRFSVLALPVLCLVPNATLFVAQWISPRPKDIWHRNLRRDTHATFIISLLWLGVPVAWRYCPAPLIYIGSVYVLGLGLKAFALLPWLFHGFTRGRRQALAALLILWTLFGNLAFWADYSQTTYSDAVGYLLAAHSLSRYGTLDVTEAVKNQDYREFYWGGWSPVHADKTALLRAPGFPYILSVPYALGDRLGVLLFFAFLVSASCIMTSGWLTVVCRASPKHALAAALLVHTTAPVLFLSHVEFPDTAGLFLFSAALWSLSVLPKRPLARLVIPVGLGMIAYALKERMVIGFLGLGVGYALDWFRLRFNPRHLWWGIPALGIVGCLLAFRSSNYLAIFAETESISSVVYQTIIGMFWDHGFGLFTIAPLFLLALAGIPLCLRRRPWPSAIALCAIGISLAVFVYTNWFAWHGGFAPPYRYLAFILPAWSLFLLPWLEKPHAYAKLLTWLTAAIAGGIYTTICTVLPILRPNRPLGVSRFWQLLEDSLGWPVHHLLPSAFMHTGYITCWMTISFVLVVLAAWWLVRIDNSWWSLIGEGPQPQHPVAHWRPLLTKAFLIVTVATACLLVGARFMPPTLLEAELMESDSGYFWSPTNPLYIRGEILLDGTKVSQRFKTHQEGTVKLSGLYVAQQNGTLQIKIDGTSQAVVPITGTVELEQTSLLPMHKAAFKGRQRIFSAPVNVSPGGHTLEMIYRGPTGMDNWLLLDYVRLETPDN